LATVGDFGDNIEEAEGETEETEGEEEAEEGEDKLDFESALEDEDDETEGEAEDTVEDESGLSEMGSVSVVSRPRLRRMAFCSSFQPFSRL
jgi:hypothetical protein